MATYSVFIHSTGTTPALWAGVPAAIIGDSKPWFPPNLGYPPLPLVPRGVKLTADDDARHLAQTLPADATAVRIFGHSYGGLVALKLAKLLTIQVESLFLLEPVLFGALRRALDRFPETKAEVDNFTNTPMFLSDVDGGTAPWLEMFIDYWNRPGSWARMPAEMQQIQLAYGWKMYQEVRSVYHDAGDFADWRMPMPLTIAWGEKTTLSAKAMAQALLAENPHARGLQMPGLNHMAIALKPQLVFAEMTAALTDS